LDAETETLPIHWDAAGVSEGSRVSGAVAEGASETNLSLLTVRPLCPCSGFFPAEEASMAEGPLSLSNGGWSLFAQGRNIVDVLMERGLVDAITNEEELRKAAEAGNLSVYCGFDPTADSLHLGNLLGILVLVWFQVRVVVIEMRPFGVSRTLNVHQHRRGSSENLLASLRKRRLSHSSILRKLSCCVDRVV
jgi:hypothetical protein